MIITLNCLNLGRSIRVITCLCSKQSLVGYLVEEPNWQIIKLLTSQTQLFVLRTLMPPTKPDFEQFWNLESLGITESPSKSDDDIALDKFNKSVTFTKGRYMVTWPWKEESPDLPENYQLALGRLKSILQQLVKIPTLLEKYDAIIKEQLNKGIIEQVTDDSEVGPLKHYIPHHLVITPLKSTTKVRIVYDASAKTRQGNKSLNECLYRCPIILPSLFGLLLRFRLSPIGMVSDVEKAFLNIHCRLTGT